MDIVVSLSVGTLESTFVCVMHWCKSLVLWSRLAYAGGVSESGTWSLFVESRARGFIEGVLLLVFSFCVLWRVCLQHINVSSGRTIILLIVGKAVVLA